MRKNQYVLVRACLYACIFLVGVSCKDTDDFLSPEKNVTTPTTAPFDFSTSNKVDLVVDYSAYNTHGAVRFAVYNQNPVKNEGSESEFIDSSIEPIYEDFTDSFGKYDATITLPAYAKVLHIVTKDFTIGLKRMAVEVVNGQAKAVLQASSNNTRGVTRVAGKTGEGELTDEFKNFHNLFDEINTSSCASTGKHIYKEWNILLGKWYENSGHPGYILDPATATPGLIIPQDEVDDLYAKVKVVLNSLGKDAKAWSPAKKELVKSADLTLIKDAEVSITPLGSQTCWTNTIGYYYYTEENKPTRPQDLNVIMLFPNTQNGLRYTTNPKDASTQGNVGTVDGEAVQLMYYPNIAAEDKDQKKVGATKIFPAGTKIGFVLKAHGWGTQSKGTEYCIKNGSSIMNKKMNICGASTMGCSYSPASGVNYPNGGEARTAKYNIVSDKGNRYAITSFEDACDDVDFDDLVFALTPANAFAEMAEIEAGKTTTTDVFAFEDMWPDKGDYDMNDVVVNCKNEKTVTEKGKVTKQTFYLTTYQKNVTLVNGLAARVKCPATKKVVMKKLDAGETDVTKAKTVTFETFNDGADGTIYYLTSKVEDDLGSTYILEFTYSAEQDATTLDEVIEPFIYRKESEDLYWEVHIPYGKPTSRMNTDYFGRLDDRTNVSKGEYYVREGLYPFAFHLTGTKAEHFFDMILSPDGDLHPIDVFYPDFLPWSQSHGESNSDWYLHKK